MLCDGCDKVRRWTRSPDGRVILCARCRVRYAWTYGQTARLWASLTCRACWTGHGEHRKPRYRTDTHER